MKKGSGEALISWCSPIDYASSIYELNCDTINLSLCSCISDTDDVRFISAKGQ